MTATVTVAESNATAAAEPSVAAARAGDSTVTDATVTGDLTVTDSTVTNRPAKNRLPDFAGIALVDILANGLAMLIIVIVLSIAARAEHEARTASQVEEVETMMSRRFSTSLVLNSLAASPPARLHDYDNSPLDQNLDPHILPIIELHRDFVREYYSGAIWTRAELLREPNAMDAFFAAFDAERKRRLRADIYDVAQYYLAMSILRDHGITIRHWHFLPGGLSLAAAGRCPPGVAAKDCATAGGGDAAADLPALAGGDGRGDGDDGDGERGAGAWPPTEFLAAAGQGRGGGGAAPGQFPGGAEVGGVGGVGGAAGNPGAGNRPQLGAGSFPNARPGRGRGTGRGLGGAAGGRPGAEARSLRFRLSSPESARDDPAGAGLAGAIDPSIDQILTVLLDFLGRLQTTVDAGASPAAQLADFNRHLRRALVAPPRLDRETRTLVDFLMLEWWTPVDADAPPGLAVSAVDGGDAALIIEPNRRLQRVGIARPGDGDGAGAGTGDGAGDGDGDGVGAAAEATVFPALRMNAHPDVWRGLTVPLQRGGMLLLPPPGADAASDAASRPAERWRAAAYIAPHFDDFIIGFVFGAVDRGGRLAVAAEDNRVRLDGRPLHGPAAPARFGARGWLVALYAALLAGLLGAALLVRRLGFRRVAA